MDRDDLEEEGLMNLTPINRKNSTREAAASLLSSYFSRRFMSGCNIEFQVRLSDILLWLCSAMLFPVVITVYVTWWFLQFFDNFFSPVYEYLLGFHVFGLGFLTSMLFIFGTGCSTGVFASSWIGSAFVGLGEYIIRKLPLIKHIYSAAKQVSAAVSPDHEAKNSFRECVLIRHPRVGEYAFGFITGQTNLRTDAGDVQLYSVYVPTNHVYVGDIFLLEDKDIIRNNLSVREGIEIVVSVGMAIPPRIISERLLGTSFSPRRWMDFSIGPCVVHMFMSLQP